MIRLRGAASALFLVVAGLVACNDAETNDRRGYTKAPLEKPTLVVTPEEASVMDELGEPTRPVVVDPEDLGAEAQQPSPAGS